MQYDVIIVGGGLVGASLALSLRDLPLSVAIIEARLPSTDDPRLFALNISSIQLLTHLGVWDEVQSFACPIEAVHVSHRGHFGAVRLQASEANLPTLGHVVPAKHLEASMHELLKRSDTITHYSNARVVSVLKEASVTSLTVETTTGTLTLSSSVIIGADGTESTLREALAIPTEVVDYHQAAIVTRIHVSEPHRGIAYERFCDGGALAMLPLPHQVCASIWSVSTEKAATLMQLSDEAYLAAAEDVMGYRLGRLKAVMTRHHFPLRMKRALQGVSGHVFLLGNALHTLHPIAAQGFNLALFEVAALVEGMTRCIARGESITSALLLRISEETERQQKMSVGVSHTLAQLFSDSTPAFHAALSLGMVGFDCLPPLKTHFIKMMTGRAGYVPPLLISH